MGTYIITKNRKEITECELANLYFARHKAKDAVTRTELVRWARRYFKSELTLIYEAELTY